jgi:hypothetical protein
VRRSERESDGKDVEIELFSRVVGVHVFYSFLDIVCRVLD